MADYLQSRAFQASLYWDSVYRQAAGTAVTQKNAIRSEIISAPVYTGKQTGMGISTTGLDNLLQSMDALLKRFPDKKKAVLTKLGDEMLRRVRSEIGGTGKVAGWQIPHMGSGGGYVAVRAKAKTYQTTKRGKRYAVGYVTNAIEGGHEVRKPRGGKGYRSRVNVAAVPGRWFYDTVRRQLAGMSQEGVDELMAFIRDGLEGRL